MPDSINWCIKILNFKGVRQFYWTSYHPPHWEGLCYFLKGCFSRRVLRIRSSTSIWKIGTCWCWPATKIDISWIEIFYSIALSLSLISKFYFQTMDWIMEVITSKHSSANSFRITSSSKANGPHFNDMLRSLTNSPAWCWSQLDLTTRIQCWGKYYKFSRYSSYSWWLFGTLIGGFVCWFV